MKTRHTSTHKICLVLIQCNLLEKLLKEYSISLFTRNWPDSCLTYSEWCSLGEPGNKDSLGIVLRTGAHQGSLEMRLALGLYSVQELTRGAGDLGYIALGLYSALVLTTGACE